MACVVARGEMFSARGIRHADEFSIGKWRVNFNDARLQVHKLEVAVRASERNLDPPGP